MLPTTVAFVDFPDVKKASEAVAEIMNQGVGIRTFQLFSLSFSFISNIYRIECVELFDDLTMSALNKHATSRNKGRIYAEKDHLFFKFQGPTPASLRETAEITKMIVEKYGGKNFTLARDNEDADDMWNERKNIGFAVLAMVPGAKGYPTDVCVPVSRLPQLIYEMKQDFKEAGLIAPIVGHVGDGNFHAILLLSDDEEMKKGKEVVRRMVKRAIALDGTCTGEHGVGVGKKEYLVEELGEGTVELMRSIKQVIDPLNLFNPGKVREGKFRLRVCLSFGCIALSRP